MLWFILFFAVAAFGATEWWSLALLELFIFTLAALCALRPDFASRGSVVLLGFGAIVALGAVQAMNVRLLKGPASLLPFTADRSQTLRALLWWTSMSVLLWAASGILLWEGALQRLALAIFIIGLFIAVVGILQRGQGNTAYYGLRPIHNGRPFGPFTNYDHAANWLVASTLVGAGLFFERLLTRRRIPLGDRLAQLALVVFILGVSAAAILETGSRGAFNAFFGAAIFSLFLAAGALSRARSRRLARAALLLSACGYVYFLYVNPQWIGFVGGALDVSTLYRLSMYRSGLRMLADFPLFGVGLGGFQQAFYAYQERMVIGLVDHVHSSWLEIALEAGLIGALAAAASTLWTVAGLARRMTQADFRLRASSAGFFAASVALILHSFVEFNFQIPANAVLLVSVLAAVSALSPRSDSATFCRSRGTWAMCLGSVGLSLLPGGFR